MIFDEEYKDKEVNTEILVDGDSFLKIARQDLCWNCNRLTYWVSTSFHAYLCSQECATEKWNEYFEALRK